MRKEASFFLVGLLFVGTAAVYAQGAGGGTSNTRTRGRGDTQWMTRIENRQQELKEYEVALQRMGKDEWMKDVIAWVAYDFSQDKKLMMDQSHRVAAVDPGKRAEVEPIMEDPLHEGPAEAWGIAWGKKPPRELKLTLTDINSTEVDCALTPAQKLGRGYLGIFQREGALLCVARGPFEDEDDPA